MQDYTFAQKTEFAEKCRALAAINADLDQLAAKIEKSSAATQAEARPKLQALREKLINWVANWIKSKAPPRPLGTT